MRMTTLPVVHWATRFSSASPGKMIKSYQSRANTYSHVHCVSSKMSQLTSITSPLFLSFQQKWRRPSSIFTYTSPFRVSALTVVPFSFIFPALNSSKLLGSLRELPLVFPNKAAISLLSFLHAATVCNISCSKYTNKQSRIDDLYQILPAMENRLKTEFLAWVDSLMCAESNGANFKQNKYV